VTPEERIRRHLTFLYGDEEVDRLWPALATLLAAFRERNPHLRENVRSPAGRLTERDVILITYGDQFSESGRAPLRALADFLRMHLEDVISGVHILPFFPYSSDDGFSIIDYRKVDPALGEWDDIAQIRQHCRLMFDAVINHVSQHSAWFQGFRRGEAPYTEYFITVAPDTDLSMVVRPRALPLLTPVETPAGVQYVWTTFSDDQIDLNYANPQVLLEIIDILLFYVEQGAEIIRLDAVAYLWKAIDRPPIHLPQTHAVIKLWRAILDAVAPGVLLISETNVPHAENLSYFGDSLPDTGSTDEAQLVYNFTLAPLVLHAFHAGNATRLTTWAKTLKTPDPGATFFNFIASHDGIGIMPANGILTGDEVQALIDHTLAHGGRVSYNANQDGSRSVYELNITLYDFLNDPETPQDDLDIRRFLASQAILLSLAGVPGIYIHSLFGSRNCQACFAESGRARSLNREKFHRRSLEAILADPATHQHRVFEGYRHLLRLRREHPAFHPAGEETILSLHDALFAVVRIAPAGDETLLCLINVSDSSHTIQIDLTAGNLPPAMAWRDLIGGDVYTPKNGQLTIHLPAYGVLWLTRGEP